MNIAHKLVGYDKASEFVGPEYDVPAQKFDLIRRIARVDPDDRWAIGNYPLDPPAAEEIAKETGLKLDTVRFDFFLEPAPVD